jgi:hypothetical protein
LVRLRVFTDEEEAILMDRIAARALEIDLVYIPPGCTDKLQPLDRTVFGVLKAFAREQWRLYNHETGGAKTTRSLMTRYLIDAWDRISREVIERAWLFDTDEEWVDEDAAPDGDDGDIMPVIDQHDVDDLE